MKWIGVAVLIGSAAVAQSPYRAGERVELQANDDHWQRCTVIDPGSDERVMRLQCEPYAGGGYSRDGGVYTATITSSAVRRERASQAAPTAAAVRMGAGYRVGQAVEIEAIGHWVPCTVGEITGSGADATIRVRCPAYPALSRAAGTYLVHNNRTGIRAATGRTGPIPAPPVAARQPPGPLGTTLKPGEYACYGAGSRILYGLGFKVTGPGRYTDLEGRNAGTFSVAGGAVTFRNGHLGGQVGRELRGNSFRLGGQASCELWG